MKTKISARKIAITAVYLAIIAMFTVIPQLTFFQFIPGIISAAIPFLVVVALAAQLDGFWTGIISSTFFGLCSFVASYVVFSTTAYWFQNPLISIMPRIFIGPAVYAVFKLFRAVFAKSKSQFAKSVLPSAIGAAAGVITNTALVLGIVALFYGNRMLDGVKVLVILGTILGVNFPIELAACIVIVPPVYFALSKYRKQTPIPQHNSNDNTQSEDGKQSGDY